jgi:hypothetical protein
MTLFHQSHFHLEANWNSLQYCTSWLIKNNFLKIIFFSNTLISLKIYEKHLQTNVTKHTWEMEINKHLVKGFLT